MFNSVVTAGETTFLHSSLFIEVHGEKYAILGKYTVLNKRIAPALVGEHARNESEKECDLFVNISACSESDSAADLQTPKYF